MSENDDEVRRKREQFGAYDYRTAQAERERAEAERREQQKRADEQAQQLAELRRTITKPKMKQGASPSKQPSSKSSQPKEKGQHGPTSSKSSRPKAKVKHGATSSKSSPPNPTAANSATASANNAQASQWDGIVIIYGFIVGLVLAQFIQMQSLTYVLLCGAVGAGIAYTFRKEIKAIAKVLFIISIIGLVLWLLLR
ncbi:hypothetical protein [Hyphobacterium sp.]|uniref:hypothetical protein n=1 Tax=Hyphobacterium sp. TaxID=2004662 RepID=UPI003BAA2788